MDIQSQIANVLPRKGLLPGTQCGKGSALFFSTKIQLRNAKGPAFELGGRSLICKRFQAEPGNSSTRTSGSYLITCPKSIFAPRPVTLTCRHPAADPTASLTQIGRNTRLFEPFVAGRLLPFHRQCTTILKMLRCSGTRQSLGGIASPARSLGTRKSWQLNFHRPLAENAWTLVQVRR